MEEGGGKMEEAAEGWEVGRGGGRGKGVAEGEGQEERGEWLVAVGTLIKPLECCSVEGTPNPPCPPPHMLQDG